MNNKVKYITVIFIILGLLLYLLGTPKGALRLALLRYGYPQNALHLSMTTDSYKTPADIGKNQTIYTIINPPVEKDTQSPLENWIISKYGPFYWGEYYGW
ncbi:MAG: hypothetical protein ACRDDE_08160 [Paraclostridium sp.]|uniref:hypothetical protein n=1 Tax=Paraclostridium sp. TaxID=2023273 RepID=UPI003EE6F901